MKANEDIYSACRVRKTAEARIITNSQIPSDFFGGHRSFHIPSSPLNKKKVMSDTEDFNVF